MADINFPPLGQSIKVHSASHQAAAEVVATMDNISYPPGDYDWASMYGVFPTADSPIPAPYHEHKGTDITVGKGSNLYAIVGGTVVDTGGTYNWVIIDTGDMIHRYLHLSRVSVSVGQKLNAGDYIGQEGGYGAAGEDTYASHLHFDMYEKSTLKVIDGFNVATGNGGGKSDVYMIVKSIDEWKAPEGKIGLWIGGVVSIKRNASLFVSPDGGTIQMKNLSGSKINATAWQGNMGEDMQTIPANLVKDMVQVSVVDQLGAMHPNAWIKISDINW